MSDPILIQSEADYDAIELEMHALLRLDRTPEQDARLDAISDAVEAFEEEHYPTSAVSQGGMLRHCLDSREKTLADVAIATGISEADLGAVLGGTATFTPEQLATVSAFFKIDPGVFLPDEPKGSP